MITGKGAAWQQLSNPNNDLSGTILQQEAMNNQAEQMRKAEEKERKAEQEKKQKEKKIEDEKFAKDLSKFNVNANTKYESFNHSLMATVRDMADKYADANMMYKETGDIKYKSQMYDLMAGIDTLKDARDKVVSNYSTLMNGIATGKISKHLNANAKSNMDKINGGGIGLKYIGGGNFEVLNLGGLDLDGNGQKDKWSLADFTNPNNFGVYEADFDLNTYNSNLKKRVGTLDKKYDANGNIIHKKGFNVAHEQIILDDFKKTFGSIGAFTNAGKSVLYQNGLDPKTIKPEQYNQFLNDRLNEVKAMYNVTDSRTPISRGSNGRGSTSKDKNSLRTTTDNILNGVPEFYNTMIGKKVKSVSSKGKDMTIEDVKYNNDNLVLQLKTGTETTTKTINLKNKEKAKAEIFSIIRPNDKVDKLIEEYHNGKVTRTGNKASDEDIKADEFEEFLNSFPEKTDNDSAFEQKLKDFGIPVKDLLYRNDTFEIYGKKFSIDNKEDMKALKEHLRKNKDKFMVTGSEKEPKNKNNKQESLRAKYNY